MYEYVHSLVALQKLLNNLVSSLGVFGDFDKWCIKINDASYW